MKKLNRFLYFDFTGFSKGKQYVCTGIQPWKNHDTGEVLGSKVEAVIYKDKTDYGPSTDSVTNLFEKVVFKVKHVVTDVSVGAEILPVNATATVYGDYRNQLSITAEDVKVVPK